MPEPNPPCHTPPLAYRSDACYLGRCYDCTEGEAEPREPGSIVVIEACSCDCHGRLREAAAQWARAQGKR
jgi:hypothetical protein